MGLVYHNGRFIPEEQIQKATDSEQVLRLLRSFLDKNEPGLVRILTNTWRSQGKAITYKELREAILAGDIDPEWLEDWMQDYSRFVVKYLQPAWELAITAAATEVVRRYKPEWHYDTMGDGARLWTATRSAEFVTNVTTAQIEGIRAVVRRAATLEDLSVDELSRVIRPMVGLTHQQSIANLKYYESLRANGMSEKKALDKSIRYAARQHRYRGYNIARTELAFAYNQGSYEGTKQAQAAGLIGEVVKVWSTADDERVCSICGSLEGKQVAMDEDFYYEHTDRYGNKTKRRINHKLTDAETGKAPPAHPSCRCAVKYVEVPGTTPKTSQSNTNSRNGVVQWKVQWN